LKKLIKEADMKKAVIFYGYFDEPEAILQEIRFDITKDRLFCLGISLAEVPLFACQGDTGEFIAYRRGRGYQENSP
jgi:hypothetical protein